VLPLLRGRIHANTLDALLAIAPPWLGISGPRAEGPQYSTHWGTVLYCTVPS